MSQPDHSHPLPTESEQLAIALTSERRSSRKLKKQIHQLQAAIAQERQTRQDLLGHLAASRWLKWGTKIGLTKLTAVLAKFSESQVSVDCRSNAGLAGSSSSGKDSAFNGQRSVTPAFSMEHALAHLADRGFDPQVVLDVGAFKGYWSESARYFFPQANFYLIEPLAEHEPRLQELCQKSHRFHYLLCAAGDRDEWALMNVAGDLAGSSLLSFHRPSQPQDQWVQVRTIDNLLAEQQILEPQLVKMDVQGYELKALEGGQRLFNTTEVFILEVSLFEFMPKQPIFHEIIQYMATREYFLFDIAGYLHRPYEDDLGQLDLVFVKGNSPLRSSNRWM